MCSICTLKLSSVRFLSSVAWLLLLAAWVYSTCRFDSRVRFGGWLQSELILAGRIDCNFFSVWRYDQRRLDAATWERRFGRATYPRNFQCSNVPWRRHWENLWWARRRGGTLQGKRRLTPIHFDLKPSQNRRTNATVTHINSQTNCRLFFSRGDPQLGQ